MQKEAVLIVLLVSLLTIELTPAQNTTATTQEDTLDCSNKPCELTCPRRTTYRAGNNCTDACDQRVCNTTLTCGCYCEDNFRRINGRCERKALCPRIVLTSLRPALLLDNRRRRPIADLLQRIREYRRN